MIGLISLLKEIQGKPKAIFMAGPAGSGKSYISKILVPSDFQTINVDDTYEELLKASGIGMKLAKMSPDELKKAGELMGQARKATDTKYKKALENANNILIDSVGGSTKTILKKKEELEDKDKKVEEKCKEALKQLSRRQSVIAPASKEKATDIKSAIKEYLKK